MRAIGAAIDRRLTGLIIARLRRTWPLLRIVPVPWLIPAVTPAARRLRRSLHREAAVAATLVAAIIAVTQMV